MSFPIQTIESSDTISQMVDKINDNFTTITAKGGGVQGIQGIQGVRGVIGDQGIQGEIGPRGTGLTLHGGIREDDVAEGYKEGDINLSDNEVFYVVYHGRWTQYTDFNISLSSPFTVVDDQIITYKEDSVKPLALGSRSIESSILTTPSLLYLKQKAEGDQTIFKSYLTYDDGVIASETINDSDLNFDINSNYALNLNGKIKLNIIDNGDAPYNLLALGNTQKLLKQTTWSIDGDNILYFNGGKIGKSGNGIEQLYLNNGGYIKSDQSILFNINNSVVSGLYQRGMVVGGVDNTSLDINSFGLVIANTLNDYAPYISLKQKSGNSPITSCTITDSPTYRISTSNVNSNVLFKNYQSPVITLNSTVNSKNVGNTLKVSGFSGGIGGDVVIQGGCSTNIINNGGDVYIAGGEMYKSSDSSTLNGLLGRIGNVIIGINPTTQSQIINDKDRASTSPKAAQYFSVNNVAIHGNKIVIDSNANNRLANSNYVDINTPTVQNPEETTLHVSGVNTLYTTTPTKLDIAGINDYQFLSGVMCQQYYIKYANNTLNITPIADFNTFINNQNSRNDSVIYNVYQIWQKVGNIVNVQLRSEWYAWNKKSDGLIHIYNNMDVSATNASGSIWNETLYHIVNGSFNTNKYLQNIIELPISIKDRRCSWVCGSGQLFTEVSTPPMTPSNKNITLTTPIYIGNEYNTNEAVYIGANADSYHDKSTYKKYDYTGFGTSFKISDKRLDENNGEDQYIGKTSATLFEDSKINYIYPTYINSNNLTPLYGLFTSMLLNYSYMLGDGVSLISTDIPTGKPK